MRKHGAKGAEMGLCGNDHKRLLDRLKRIEGQVRGVARMVEEDRSCMEVLKQIAAVTGAMRSAGMVVLEEHLKGCVSDAMKGDEGAAMIDDIIDLFNKFSK